MKVIAFYLPQYHAIPENDRAHGKGFTEWVNTKKAQPLFEGQYQPRTPLGGNYYNLLNESVMVKQAKLAKEYGVYGFCYYHYWFGNGKKLLEKPIENMLKNKNIDIPFCLCWANENWCKRWDGGNNEIIVEQDYGSKESWNNHIDYLMSFFLDERYIKIDEMPLLVIYKPELIPNFNDMITLFQNAVRKKGFKGVKIASQYPTIMLTESEMKKSIDYFIHFEPRYIQEYCRVKNQGVLQKKSEDVRKAIKHFMINHSFGKVVKLGQRITGKMNIENKELEIRDYDNDWNCILKLEKYGFQDLAGGFVDWDNTPRNVKGLAYKGATPEKFEKYMSQLVKNVDKSQCQKYIFINAWNEWAEGAYLEPDEKFKYNYLEALSKALNKECLEEIL